MSKPDWRRRGAGGATRDLGDGDRRPVLGAHGERSMDEILGSIRRIIAEASTLDDGAPEAPRPVIDDARGQPRDAAPKSPARWSDQDWSARDWTAADWAVEEIDLDALAEELLRESGGRSPRAYDPAHAPAAAPARSDGGSNWSELESLLSFAHDALGPRGAPTPPPAPFTEEDVAGPTDFAEQPRLADGPKPAARAVGSAFSATMTREPMAETPVTPKAAAVEKTPPEDAVHDNFAPADPAPADAAPRRASARDATPLEPAAELITPRAVAYGENGGSFAQALQAFAGVMETVKLKDGADRRVAPDLSETAEEDAAPVAPEETAEAMVSLEPAAAEADAASLEPKVIEEVAVLVERAIAEQEPVSVEPATAEESATVVEPAMAETRAALVEPALAEEDARAAELAMAEEDPMSVEPEIAEEGAVLIEPTTIALDAAPAEPSQVPAVPLNRGWADEDPRNRPDEQALRTMAAIGRRVTKAAQQLMVASQDSPRRPSRQPDGAVLDKVGVYVPVTKREAAKPDAAPAPQQSRLLAAARRELEADAPEEALRAIGEPSPDRAEALMSPQARTETLRALQAVVRPPEPGASPPMDVSARDEMKPLLAEWLNSNMPKIVERLVMEELQRMRKHGDDDA